MRIRAIARWNPKRIGALNIPRGAGWLTLEVQEAYRAKMEEELRRLSKVQAEKFMKALERWNGMPPDQRPAQPSYDDTALELEIDLTIHYKKRSIEANNLYWKLLEIEANWINGTPAYRDGYWSAKTPGQIITPEQIHEDDLETYAEKTAYYVPKGSLFGFCRGVEFEVGKVKGKEPVGDGNTYKVEVWKTTSYMDTKEFRVWVQRVIERITDGGLLRCDEGEFIRLREDFKEILKGDKKK